jgi:hypothetical protein
MTIQKFIDEARERNRLKLRDTKTNESLKFDSPYHINDDLSLCLEMLEILSVAVEFYATEKHISISYARNEEGAYEDEIEKGDKAQEALQQCERIVDGK